jgi:hypothetical protein
MRGIIVRSILLSIVSFLIAFLMGQVYLLAIYGSDTLIKAYKSEAKKIIVSLRKDVRD